jgi:hypothetical protein
LIGLGLDGRAMIVSAKYDKGHDQRGLARFTSRSGFGLVLRLPTKGECSLALAGLGEDVGKVDRVGATQCMRCG